MANWFQKEQLNKTQLRSEDGKYRDGNPNQPVQPVMSYRFGERGSDTMRPEVGRTVTSKDGRAPYTPPNSMGSPYRSVGGVKILPWQKANGC